MTNKLILSVMPEKYCICRLESSSEIPSWVFKSTFLSITKTEEELSIVCREDLIPTGIKSEKNWRVLKIEGPLDFSLTGILSSVLSPLAEAGISIFAVSTYDTDYVLVKADKLEEAVRVLSAHFKINS